MVSQHINPVGRPWCLRPISIVRKTHLAIWTTTDEVPTQNLISNRHLSIQMTNSQTQSKIPKMPLGQTWSTLVKFKVNGQCPKVNNSSQQSTSCVPREYAQLLWCWPKSGALTMYAQRTSRYAQRRQPRPKTQLRAYYIKPFRQKLRSKPKNDVLCHKVSNFMTLHGY